MQTSLFGVEAPRFDEEVRRTERHVLSGGAWVEHWPGFLVGHERVFRQLEAECPWQRQRRRMYDREVEVPRLVARAPGEGATARLLRRAAASLSARYGQPLSGVSLAYYRSGRDGVAFHGDRVGRSESEAVVAILSVGSPRRFALKPRMGSGSLGFELGWGDLLVMGGSCQRTWLHGVPKRASAHPRISIAFRPVASHPAGREPERRDAEL